MSGEKRGGRWPNLSKGEISLGETESEEQRF